MGASLATDWLLPCSGQGSLRQKSGGDKIRPEVLPELPLPPMVFRMRAKLLQACSTLCTDLMGHSPLGSSIHGILQARILECIAVLSSRGSSQPRNQTRIFHGHLPWQVGSLPQRHVGWVHPVLAQGEGFI